MADALPAPPAQPSPTIPAADRLTGQLYHLPEIIGRLGISIANAQKALNADYLENVRQLLVMIAGLIGDEATDPPAKPGDPPPASRRAAAEALLKALAPSRYQFTETSIDFSADLSETFSLAGSGGLGAGFGAVVVNASLAVGFARDYRAAARIKSILHAIPANEALTGTFLAQADKMDASKMTLPARSQVDAALYNQLADVREALGGQAVPRLPAEDAPAAAPRIVAKEAEKATADAKSAKDQVAKYNDAGTPAADQPKIKSKAVAFKDSAQAHLSAAQAALLEVKEAEQADAKAKVDAAKTEVDDAAAKVKGLG